MDKSIIIIGAGMGGLAAGIYGQINGYQTQIFEMQTKPGGAMHIVETKGVHLRSLYPPLFRVQAGHQSISDVARTWRVASRTGDYGSLHSSRFG